jgi:hypothetical protein
MHTECERLREQILLETEEQSYVNTDFSELQKTAADLTDRFVHCNFKPKVA